MAEDSELVARPARTSTCRLSRRGVPARSSTVRRLAVASLRSDHNCSEGSGTGGRKCLGAPRHTPAGIDILNKEINAAQRSKIKARWLTWRHGPRRLGRRYEDRIV